MDPIHLLRQDFDNHVQQDREWKNEQEKKWSEIGDLMRDTAQMVHDNAQQIHELTEDTKDIVATYKDIKGAVRVGSGVQKFMLWLTKWGAIGVGLTAAITYLINFFNKPPVS